MISDSSSSDRAALPGPTDGVPGAEEALEGAAGSIENGQRSSCHSQALLM